MDKYAVLAEAAYIDAVDQNVAILPLGRSFDPDATGPIVLTAAADYSDITNPNFTTIVDHDTRTFARINGRGLLPIRSDFDRRLTGCHADWTAVNLA